nr:DDE transposase family protein [Verrucomicrobium sp. 3C]
MIREHWGGIEIRNHWRRDVLMGEDRSRSRQPNLLANLALIRNALLSLLSERLGENNPSRSSANDSAPPLNNVWPSSPPHELQNKRPCSSRPFSSVAGEPWISPQRTFMPCRPKGTVNSLCIYDSFT